MVKLKVHNSFLYFATNLISETNKVYIGGYAITQSVKTIFNNIWIVSRLQKAMPGNKTGPKVLKFMGFQIKGYKKQNKVRLKEVT